MSDIAGLVVAAVALICWCMTFYKLRDLVRNPHHPPLRALWTALFTITLSMTIQPVAPALDRLVGTIDFGRALSNALTIVAAAAAQAFLLYMADAASTVRQRVRLRIAVMSVCVMAIGVLFAIHRPAYGVSDAFVRSGDYYRNNPASFTVPFVHIYLAYLGWAMIEVFWLARRYARVVSRPLQRLGLRMISAGSLAGLAYVVLKATTMIADRLPDGTQLLMQQTTTGGFTVSILLILVGSTIPSWGPVLHLDRVGAWWTTRQALRRIRPLWSLMCQAAPQIQLVTMPRWSAVALSRMIVEIHDGYAVLRPWFDPAVAAQARLDGEATGLDRDPLDAAVEAAVLGAAAAARRRGAPPTVPPAPVQLARPGGRPGQWADATAELNWLTMVAVALQASRHQHIPTRQ